jgi:hypothetical protein
LLVVFHEQVEFALQFKAELGFGFPSFLLVSFVEDQPTQGLQFGVVLILEVVEVKGGVVELVAGGEGVEFGLFLDEKFPGLLYFEFLVGDESVLLLESLL